MFRLACHQNRFPSSASSLIQTQDRCCYTFFSNIPIQVSWSSLYDSCIIQVAYSGLMFLFEFLLVCLPSPLPMAKIIILYHQSRDCYTHASAACSQGSAAVPALTRKLSLLWVFSEASQTPQTTAFTTKAKERSQCVVVSKAVFF